MSNVLSDVFDVFSEVSAWIVGEISAIEPLFYKADSGLTFIGVCSVAALGVGVTFLLVNIIKNFIRFR